MFEVDLKEIKEIFNKRLSSCIKDINQSLNRKINSLL